MANCKNQTKIESINKKIIFCTFFFQQKRIMRYISNLLRTSRHRELLSTLLIKIFSTNCLIGILKDLIDCEFEEKHRGYSMGSVLRGNNICAKLITLFNNILLFFFFPLFFILIFRKKEEIAFPFFHIFPSFFHFDFRIFFFQKHTNNSLALHTKDFDGIHQKLI